MAIEQYLYNGKDVYLISELDLSGCKKTGKRIRAKCPIHGSRDRDLSLSPWYPLMDEDDTRLAGWGNCHSINCGATVLVKEWNPRFAAYITKRPLEASGEPKIQLTAKDIEQASDWQRQELAALNKIYASTVEKLTCERSAAYLAQRGLAHFLPFLQAMGIGYIPAQDAWTKQPPDVLRKWCDRLIFPFTTAEGERGFLGRTLQLWQPGMDENEHKRVLTAHHERVLVEHPDQRYKHEIRRYEKTYRSGFFNLDCASQSTHLYITEGVLDAVPLLVEGLPNVVAVAGMTIDAAALPKNVLSVTLAYDADVQGQQALAGTSDALKAVVENMGRAGIQIDCRSAPNDGRGKDWSERYRLHGRDGLAALLSPAPDDENRCGSEEEERQGENGSVDDDLPVTLLDACADCGTLVTAEDRDFFYVPISDDQAACYCSQCRDESGQRRRPLTIEERARQLAQERQEAEKKHRQEVYAKRRHWQAS